MNIEYRTNHETTIYYHDIQYYTPLTKGFGELLIIQKTKLPDI